MATKVIDNNEARAPFFGDKMSFVTGLDPLGLQNPSTQAYSYLLPGLNNVTSRIRNYSFYCWLLQEYANRIKSLDPQEQKRFIRRAEYIIALLSVHTGIESISGSNYATNRFKEGITKFNLQTGTYNDDGSTINTYWQYGFGIFGQYYIGSLRQIGLLEEPVDPNGQFIGIYRRTSSNPNVKVTGEDLANAFDSCISTHNKTLFFSCISNGTIDIDQLETLAKEFDLTEIKINSRESILLIQLLTDKDEPGLLKEDATSMRRDSIIHILRFINNDSSEFDQRKFTKYAYKQKGKISGTENQSLTGWYYYQLNEYFQVANVAIFNGSLDHLQDLVGPGWLPLPEFIESTTNTIVDSLISKGLVVGSEQSLESILESSSFKEEELFDSMMSNYSIERITYAFALLLQLYNVNKMDLPNLRIYINERSIGDDDDVLSYFWDFGLKLKLSVKAFVSEFISVRILGRHQYVAYRKMGGGSQSTQKFIIEDNYIRQIGNFGPGYTSPRIGSLINFLYDLKLVDGNYKLTKSGKDLISAND